MVWKVKPEDYTSKETRVAEALDIELNQINFERDRRRAEGFQFPNSKGKYYQARNSDIGIINGFSAIAAAKIAAGKGEDKDYRWNNPDADFEFITADNTRVKIDAKTMVALAAAASKFVDAVNVAARKLKDKLLNGEAIKDVTKNSLWP